MPNALRIGFVVSEFTPLCKTGGLADVAGALPPALAAEGHQVAVFCPYYREAAAALKKLNLTAAEVLAPFPLWLGNELRFTPSIHEVRLHGFTAYLVKCDPLYDRDGLYQQAGRDWPDNLVRFSLFAQASLEAMLLLGLELDILHSHDWQAALVPVQLHHRRGLGPLCSVPRVLTIHNLGYQGVFEPGEFPLLNLPGSAFSVDCLEYYGKLNLLKAGIICADWVTTVSPTYSREILTAEFGAGLEGVLHAVSHKLSGIINGIEDTVWDPAADEFLPANYSADKPEGKRECKRRLLAEVGLPEDPGRPLIGMITRLASQKGLDLVVQAADALLAREVALVVLGTGDPELHQALTALAGKYPDRLAVLLKFDNALAHRIEAGADMFLMPSRYEPCGLNQMYSMRYGTIPVVSRVGGLKDTVIPYTADTAAAGTARGFIMEEISPEGLLKAVDQALGVYADTEAWARLVKHVMALDFSWRSSARQYAELYRRLLDERGGTAR